MKGKAFFKTSLASDDSPQLRLCFHIGVKALVNLHDFIGWELDFQWLQVLYDDQRLADAVTQWE